MAPPIAIAMVYVMGEGTKRLQLSLKITQNLDINNFCTPEMERYMFLVSL
jgi:hypothetical protein